MILKFTSLNSNLRMNASPPNRTSSRLRWLAGFPLLLCFLFINSGILNAQITHPLGDGAGGLMTSAATVSCDVPVTMYYDSGGEGCDLDDPAPNTGSYDNNANTVSILCPDDPTKPITLEFLEADIETRGAPACWDFLTVHNGNSTAAPVLFNGCGEEGFDSCPGGFAGDGSDGGNVEGGPQDINASASGVPANANNVWTSSDATGCLTVAFTSDGSVTQGGWIATLGCGVVPPPPPALVNDLCAGALPILCGETLSGTTAATVTNSAATTTDAPGTCGTTFNTAGGVWYNYTALINQDIVLETCGSGFDTRIGVFSGACGALVCETGNNDFCGAQSTATFSAVIGTTYSIYVTGTTLGAFDLTLTCLAPAFCNVAQATGGFPNSPGCEAAVVAAMSSCATIWGAACASLAETLAPDCCGCLDSPTPLCLECIATLDNGSIAKDVPLGTSSVDFVYADVAAAVIPSPTGTCDNFLMIYDSLGNFVVALANGSATTFTVTCPVNPNGETFFVTADDDGIQGGNESTQVELIVNANDITLPTFNTADVPDLTISCDQDFTDLIITGDVISEMDECDDGVADGGPREATFTDIITLGCFNGGTGSGSVLREWNLEDANGNVFKYEQTITILDPTPPTFTVPTDALVDYCTGDATPLPAVTGDVTDEADNCTSPIGDATFTDGPMMAGSCPNNMTFVRTWSLVDACGNANNQMQLITLQDTTEATSTLADITVNNDAGMCNAAVTLIIADTTVSDNCSAFADLTITNDGGGIGAGDGLLDASGTYPVDTTIVTYTITDECGNISSHEVTVIVIDNETPTIDLATCPADIVISNDVGNCDNIVSWAPPSFSDNCGGAVPSDSITISTIDPKGGNTVNIIQGGAIDFSDFPVGTSTVIYTASINGVAISCDFTVTVNDVEPPTIIGCPPNQVYTFASCAGGTNPTPSFVNQGAYTDNCPNSISVIQWPSAGDYPTLGDIPNISVVNGDTMHVTLTLNDDQGNGDACTFIVTLQGGSPPVPDVAGTLLAPENSECGPLTLVAPTAVDACGNPVCGEPFPVDPSVWNLVAGTGPCPGSTVVSSFTGTGTQPIPDTGILAGNACTPATTLLDNAAVGLVGTIGANPGDFVIENVTINIAHAFDADLDISLISPTGTVLNLSSDNGGGGDDYISTVFDDNAIINITAGIAPFTGEFLAEGGSLNAAFANEVINGNWTLSICDDFGTDAGTLLDWSITFSNTPVGSIPEYQFLPGNHVITWVYDDGFGNSSSQLQQVNVAIDSEAPTFNCSNVTVSLDENGEAAFVPTNPSTNLPLNDDFNGLENSGAVAIGFNFDYFGNTFSNLYVSNNGFVTFAPVANGNDFTTASIPNAGVDNNMIAFAWTDLDPDAGGSIDYFVSGVAPNRKFVLSFTDVPNWLSTAIVTAQLVLHESSNLIEIYGTDIQSGGIGSQATQGIENADGTIGIAVPGRNNVVWATTDDYVAFVPDGAGSYTLNQSGPFQPAPTPTALTDAFDSLIDNCSTPTISFSDTAFDCDDIPLSVITLTATDAVGNTSTCFVTVTVEDNLAPMVNNIPADQTVDCNSIPAASTSVSATDNCDIQGINFNESNDQVGNATMCGDYNYTITREWTATDGSGNTAVGTQIITVQDTVGPTFTGLPAQIMANADLLNCSANVTLFATSTNYSDNCAANSVLTLTNAGAPFGAGNGTNDASGTYPVGSTFVTFTATDPCGNSGQQTVEVIVTDGVAPVALCSATTISIPTGSDTVAILPIYIDNGSVDNCASTLAMTVSPSSFDCTQLGNQTVTLTVSDGTLTGSCATTVTVQDLTPPDEACAADFSITVDASGMASITVADINAGSSDACSGLASTTIDVMSFGLGDFGPNTVTLTATDVSGNTSTCSTVVTVQGPTTCFDVGSAVGGAGNVIEIPVTVTDFTSVNSFQFSLNITGDNAMIDLGEFEELLTNVHPDLNTPGSILFPSIQYDSLATNDTLVQVQYGDILDGNGDPYDGLLDTVDVAAVLDTILFANTLSISYLGDASLPGVTLTDGTVVFTLNVLLTGNIGESTTILNIPNTNNTPPEILYDFGMGNLIVGTPCFIPGGFLINELIISGAIYTEPAANCNAPAPNVPASSPVGLVDVELYEIFTLPTPASLEDTYTTGNDGLFEFTINGAGDFELRPEKDINWGNQLGTITSFDVQRIQAHAVGATPLCTAYKKIAADVNDNGQITTVDAALLNFFVINNVPPLPTPNDPPNKSWRFVDAKQVLTNPFDANVPAFNEVIVFDNLISDTTNNDFIGVKIGDIDNNIDPLQFTTGGGDPNLQGEGRTGSLEFVIADATTKADESLAVDFTAKSFDNMVAYQWILKFDEKALAFNGMTAKALENLSDNNVGVQALDYGMISFTWYSVDAVSHTEEDVLFTLNFTGLKDGVKLSDIFEVQEFNVFPTEAYTNNAEIRDIELGFSTDKETVAFELFQNQPNPFKDETSISFKLPTATAATLTISDATGRTLSVIEGDYDKGYNEISVNRNTLPASGVLYYQLETSEFSATKKMIIVE